VSSLKTNADLVQITGELNDSYKKREGETK
jgi:hypothetical protein